MIYFTMIDIFYILIERFNSSLFQLLSNADTNIFIFIYICLAEEDSKEN